MLSNSIWDVGADTGDRYDGVDVLLPCGEAEFDSSWGDNLGNGERTSPLVVQLLHGAVGGIVLEIQPGLVSDLVLWCCLMVPFIIPLHVVHCPSRAAFASSCTQPIILQRCLQPLWLTSS